MTIPTLLVVATSNVAAGTSKTAGSSPAAVPHNWAWVLALIGGGGALVLFLLFRFYKALQNSEFISELLGLPSKLNPTRAQTPPESVFRFAEEFLARRTEFWLLYAQVFVATFFIAAITALLLVGVVEVQAGLPALSTVVGIVLGKTLLSAKGTPLTAQEQLAGLTPSNIKLPAITEEAVAGGGTKLTADPGEWSGQLPMTYAYVWRRKDAKGEEPIPEANESTYTTVAADKGKSITVMVSAKNAGGVSTATSNPVSVN
ncbi:MAG TPA: hypothetical protein VK272_11210 [Solirubrobacteraceae bacterium]|nr:hypothetical protein [Solirubrobacteraceae bacterium]